MKKVESYDNFFSDEEKKNIIKDYIENFFSIKELCIKYNIKSKTWIKKILGKNVRSFSEANKIAHLKYPEKYKLSDEAKNKIRAARLKWMKEHPEQTAWRLKNMSYPEKCFKKILEDNGLDKKYLIYREYSIFPYFIDFAFINEKLAVEIDGSQHLEEERKKRDEEKDKLLLSKGWKVIRITATEVIHNNKNVLNSILELLNEDCKQYNEVGIFKAKEDKEKSKNIKKVGILKSPKKYQKAIRGEDGLTDKQRLNALNKRKVERPTKEKLFEMIKSESFTAIGKKYGVSDKAISKWCQQYNLPYRKKDIDKEHKYSKKKHICLYCGKEYYAYYYKSKFCCDECYKAYISKNGLLNKEKRKKSFNWIYYINDDGSFINKRVSDDDINKYVNDGWIRGKKIKNG